MGPLPDSAYTASSILSENSNAPNGRLNISRAGESKSVWCSEPGDSNSYLEINLGKLFNL